jgi:prolyl oligopeptidase
MIDPRPTIDRPDDDPWRWLEEIEGSRALDWVTAQTAATLSRYADARFEADRDAVRAILDLPDNIPWITRRGGMLYNFWRDAASPRDVSLDEVTRLLPGGKQLGFPAVRHPSGSCLAQRGAHLREPAAGLATVAMGRGL